MNKQRKLVGVLLTACISACLLALLFPYAQADYLHLRISFPKASALGANTNLIQFDIELDNSVVYSYTGDGQIYYDLPENSYITQMDAYVTIEDNYADSQTKAKSRTRIKCTIYDGNNSLMFENYVGENLQAYVNDNGTYYTVNWREDDTLEPDTALPIKLSQGTWDITLNYDVYAIQTS